MTKIIGINELNQKLNEMYVLSEVQDREGAVVGFTQRYALFVHERKAKHKKGKEWKFLETPTRRLVNSGELQRIMAITWRKTKSLTKSCIVACLRIQREAMKITPIDTGALRASAYTVKESQMAMAQKTAFEKSEGVRKKKKLERFLKKQ